MSATSKVENVAKLLRSGDELRWLDSYVLRSSQISLPSRILREAFCAFMAGQIYNITLSVEITTPPFIILRMFS